MKLLDNCLSASNNLPVWALANKASMENIEIRTLRITMMAFFDDVTLFTCKSNNSYRNHQVFGTFFKVGDTKIRVM